MNRLPGLIVSIDAHGSIMLVEVAMGMRRFSAMLVGDQEGRGSSAWATGMPVNLLFKETEVALAKNLSGLISMRNRMPATVAAVERGRLLTRVMLDIDGHAIASIITTRSADALRLMPGDAVEGLVKSNEMTVMPMLPGIGA